ncbi:hypothetical protein LTR97_001364 [Elasticomyces elasticus]|uniref:Heterokaryon incompatibility domain-containing protein n=1 Tax=Elasticomyces elasticus TaxID=574655 RepID=A0AAN8A520_9PEZI|nr:hypothetical protein LTR97_001364 [Elasticomyces elasticus]
MHRVYSQACFTIAASASSGSDLELFNDESCGLKCDMDIVSISKRLPGRRKSTLNLFDISKFYPRQWYDHVNSGPLSKRAWTLQETMLSPRTIYYSNSQLYWECRHIRQSEDNLLFEDIRTTWRSTFFQEPPGQNLTTSGGGLYTSPPVDLKSFSFFWYRQIIADEYSTSNLTNGRDKLVAVSSLARALHAKRPNPYYAGLWGDCLLEGLCWTSHSPARKCPEYRAPSWSWASQDSSVSYLNVAWMDTEDFQTHYDCQIVRVDTTLRTDDPFSMVTDGVLVLNAKVLKGKIRVDRVGDMLKAECYLDNGGHGKAYLDDDDEELPGTVFAVYVGWAMYGYQFMIVRTSELGKTVRVGFFDVGKTHESQAEMDAHLLSTPRQEITIW